MATKVLKTGNCIEIQDTTIPESSFLPVANIARVSGYFNPNRSGGMSGSLEQNDTSLSPTNHAATIVTIEMIGGIKVTFEAGDVVNQTTWQGKTQASLNNALAAINAWI